MSAPACRACGSSHVTLRGRKNGEFIRREFEFYQCLDCELLFVEPFTGFEIYNDAYYRGAGPDPYVDYETEYRDWRRSDRGLEFDDMARIAAAHIRAGERRREKGEGNQAHASSGSVSDPSPFSLLPSPGAERPPSPSSLLPSPGAERPPSPFSLLPSPGAERPPSPDAQRPAAPLRWLDFGCGSGAFLKYLRERGSFHGRPLEITGHDVGSYADLLKTQDGFRILNLDELSRESDARYDVISMIEVVEHLPSPLEPLALVSRLLKPGGLLLLTTGNLDSPIARRQGIHYRYCAPEIHVCLFNPRCLARLYRRVGLEPYAVRYRGAVKFKVVKSLRHRRALRGVASAALSLPPLVRLVDILFGVSAMPCAVKPVGGKEEMGKRQKEETT